jgi:hypothetical protein
MDDGNKSGAELLGQNEEPNFESWHQGIYCMHSHGDLDELDLDFANTLECKTPPVLIFAYILNIDAASALRAEKQNYDRHCCAMMRF